DKTETDQPTACRLHGGPSLLCRPSYGTCCRASIAIRVDAAHHRRTDAPPPQVAAARQTTRSPCGSGLAASHATLDAVGGAAQAPGDRTAGVPAPDAPGPA